MDRLELRFLNSNGEIATPTVHQEATDAFPWPRTNPGKKRERYNSVFLRKADVRSLFASRRVIEDLEKAGWLVPRVKQPRLVLYLREEVYSVLTRVIAGEYPTQ